MSQMIAALLGACLIGWCAADTDRRQVTDMLDLDPRSCSGKNLDPFFDDTLKLAESCQENVATLLDVYTALVGDDEDGMEPMTPDDIEPWKHNLARKAWWSFNLPKDLDDYDDDDDVGIDIQAISAPVFDASEYLTDKSISRRLHPTACSENAYPKKAIYGYDIDPQNAMVLTALGACECILPLDTVETTD